MSQKKQPDKMLGLKYRGYIRSNTPPGGVVLFPDLVNFAKFFLCKELKYLWKDPIWDEYTDEEILIEYFSFLFAKNEDYKKEFEVAIDAGSDVYGEDVFDWLDRMVDENQVEQKKLLEALPEKITFDPNKPGEE